ncbi:oxidoreductase [Allostella vacuolata]|nr:oxidoreductase [Stella vacuolata]
MEMRKFGRSGLELSALGFGCGAVGGLMVRASAAEQERTVADALAAGINYFDTAVQYGDGQSERNLGRVLRALRPPGPVVIGTKVRLQPDEFGRIGDAIVASLEGSLSRLGLERVDILYLHNPITAAGAGMDIALAQVLDEVIPAFDRLQAAGKMRLAGITAVGETAALKTVLATGAIDAAQVVHNLLNPSAATGLPAGWPGQDYARLLEDADAAGVGVVGIRVLAGGALSGTAERHPIASPAPAPIGSGQRYEDDLDRARRLLALVEEGLVGSLAEAATRFPLSHPAVGTILVGMASHEQFAQALAAARLGPLPEAALARLAELQPGFGAG